MWLFYLQKFNQYYKDINIDFSQFTSDEPKKFEVTSRIHFDPKLLKKIEKEEAKQKVPRIEQEECELDEGTYHTTF